MSYKLDVQFIYNTEYWTNTFYSSAGSLATAEDAADELVALLATAVQNSVTIDKVRLTHMPVTGNSFTDRQYSTAGSGGSSAPAPLFNVVRWIFGTGAGRNTSMYFRGGVTPSNIGDNQKFTNAAVTFNNGIVAGLRDLSIQLVNVHGVGYSTYAASPYVGMRQLRRGSRRRSTPVI